MNERERKHRVGRNEWRRNRRHRYMTPQELIDACINRIFWVLFDRMMWCFIAIVLYRLYLRR